MQLDMNLLVALDALLEEGSVGGAADRLHVTSPAMSRTLGRIRDATGDPILLRTGRHMTPTAYAVSVREEVHAVVTRAQQLLARQRKVDLAKLERTFTIQCHDAIASALGARWLEGLRASAPQCVLRLMAEAPLDTNDLRHGLVDLEIGASMPAHPDLNHTILGQDRLVIAMRARHPLARSRLSVRAYSQALHITVSRRGRVRDRVDDLLAAQGLERRVAAAVPSSSAALLFASESDFLVAVPEKLCAAAIKALRLKTVPMPINLPASPVVSAWHRRHDTDPAHEWLRNLVHAEIHALISPK